MGIGPHIAENIGVYPNPARDHFIDTLKEGLTFQSEFTLYTLSEKPQYGTFTGIPDIVISLIDGSENEVWQVTY